MAWVVNFVRDSGDPKASDFVGEATALKWSAMTPRPFPSDG